MKKLSHVENAVRAASRDTVVIYEDAFERLKRINLRSYFGKTASALAICFAFVLFSLLRDGVGNLYMSIFIPIFIAEALIVLYGEIYCSSSWMSLFISFLVTTGTALQIFMMPPEDVDTNLQIIYYILFVFAAVIMGADGVYLLGQKQQAQDANADGCTHCSIIHGTACFWRRSKRN